MGVTAEERAQAFANWHGGRWDAGDEARLAGEFEAHAKEAMGEVEEILKSGCADERIAADAAHRKHKYEDESRHEHAGMAIWRAVEAIRAMVPK